MTRITTRCPRCGRVELEAEDLTLVRSPRENTAWYLYDCIGCAHRVVKPAPASVVLALVSVKVTSWIVPAEVLEREVGPDEQSPIDVDDVLDVLLWLRACPDPIAAFRTPRTGEVGSPPARPNAA